jgi:hypothetical protein
VGGARVRAFTLVELIVAVGAVALLTVGVGQVFQSVGSLVSTGTAIAEIEQLARAVESQMRADFAALNRMREDEVFMAIRCRRVGDIDQDGQVQGTEIFRGTLFERALYMSPEAREADQKDGLAPYSEGSRAVTRRLDEIIFLGFGGDGGLYHSYTPTCKDHPVDECDACVRDVIADTVRIYYGHGLRPAIDVTEFDVEVDSKGRHWRSYIPDGDFGSPVGSENRYDGARQANNGLSMGRNEYAGDWPLLRHAMLLYGGSAAGERIDSGVEEAIICNDREFAPYIRDAEAYQRFDMVTGNAYRNISWGLVNEQFEGHTRGSRWNPDDASRPRLMQTGRVDICAQSPADIKRWLEGWDGDPASDASPFDDGRFNDPSDATPSGGTANPLDDYPLWEYGPSPNAFGQGIETGVFSAIAGCFTRFMCETEPPIVNRGDEYNPEDTCDSVMDTHAVLASRCSNFEIAWSDPQSRWRADESPVIPPPLDPRTAERLNNIKSGDVIWYDYDFSRRLLVPMEDYVSGTLGYTDLDADLDAGPQTDPEVLHLNIAGQRDLLPGYLRNTNQWREGKVFINPADERAIPPISATQGANRTRYWGYDWRMTGGAYDEYMAVFPYRVPDIGANRFVPGDDRYLDQAFPKPQFVRVRMTLHDSQMRLEEGKDFEFIFLIDLQ